MSFNLAKYKPFVMPVAMVGGGLCHRLCDTLGFLTAPLIFVMLFLTFCRIRPRELKVTKVLWILLAVQVLGAIAVYFAINPFSHAVAQGAMICMFCPTATAAPVITGMLGGSIARLASFSLISNATVAILAPILFTFMGNSTDVGFFQSVMLIASKVAPLIILPMAIAFLILAISPKTHDKIGKNAGLSFYFWAVSLFIVVGRAVNFIIAEPKGMVDQMVWLAVASLILCLVQFITGRKIGRRFGDKISGAQGLGQKNTVLAIWMALVWFNPVASVGPASYILWQNTINSYQLYLHNKRIAQEKENKEDKGDKEDKGNKDAKERKSVK